jgi:ankyrin repeat protein
MLLVPSWAPAQDAPSAGENRKVCDEYRRELSQTMDQLQDHELNFHLFEAATKGCKEVVEDLLSRGATVLARDRMGNSAMMLAARMGRTDLVRYLVERGAHLDQRNINEGTALILAVQNNRTKTAETLVALGADVNAASRKGITPVIAAAFQGNVKLLKLFLDKGADPKAIDSTGKGALVYAAGRGQLKVMEMLVEAGIAPDGHYDNGLTPLMWAAGHADDVPVPEGLAAVQFLIGRGADVNAVDERGRTSLMIAAELGHAEVVALLLKSGAKADTRDKDGKTAADLASSDAVRDALKGA